MTPFTSTLIGSLHQYAGKMKTMRDEARTRRLLDSLPADLRKDIGWPDQYPELRRRAG